MKSFSGEIKAENRMEDYIETHKFSNNHMKKVIVSLLIIVTLLSLSACVNRTEKYTSPSGNNKITVEYDFVSRPCVIYEGDCIWKYPGNGFNEEVFFDVEWIDDDTVKLIYNDESHNGKYYEEFEIDL